MKLAARGDVESAITGKWSVAVARSARIVDALLPRSFKAVLTPG